MYSEGGMFLGTVDSIEADRGRINFVLTKIAKGLWLLETGFVLADEGVKWTFDYASPVSERLPEVVEDIVRKLPIRYAGPDVAGSRGEHTAVRKMPLSFPKLGQQRGRRVRACATVCLRRSRCRP